MATDPDSLLQERAEIVEKAKSVMDEADGELSGEQEEKVDNMLERAKELRQKAADAEERQEALRQHEEDILRYEDEQRSETRREEQPPEVRDMSGEERLNREMEALHNWIVGEADEEDRQFLYPAGQQARRARAENDPELREAWKRAREQRALGAQATSAGSGGEFVPEGFLAEIHSAQKAFGGIDSVARVIETDSGNDMPVPTVDDTSNVGGIVGENTSISNTTKVDTGSEILKAFKYHSGPVKYSIEFEQDSAFAVREWLRSIIGTRIGRAIADHTITRTTSQTGPNGLKTASTGAVSISQGTTTLGYNQMVDLKTSVDLAYRNGPGVAFAMHDDTLHNLAKVLSTQQGGPLWQPSLRSGVPDRILGTPIVLDNNIDTMTTDNTTAVKPVWYGDFNEFAIRRVMPISIFRFRERYLEEGAFGLVAFQRYDARPLFGSSWSADRKPFRAILATT